MGENPTEIRSIYRVSQEKQRLQCGMGNSPLSLERDVGDEWGGTKFGRLVILTKGKAYYVINKKLKKKKNPNKKEKNKKKKKETRPLALLWGKSKSSSLE